MSTQITSIEELKRLTYNKTRIFFISLYRGTMRTTKEIEYSSSKEYFYIRNMLDDTTQRLKEYQLEKKTSIIEAINNGTFYMDKD